MNPRGTAMVFERWFVAIYQMADSQRENGHAGTSVDCLLVVADGNGVVLGRSIPTDTGKND
jgi:hypothetical protein